jgi:hypothetical protein
MTPQVGEIWYNTNKQHYLLLEQHANDTFTALNLGMGLVHLIGIMPPSSVWVKVA